MLIFDVSVFWQHPHEAGQRILSSPKRTERGLLEEPADESERNSSSWAGFDQLVDDQSHQLVDLDDWMWHGWRKGLKGGRDCPVYLGRGNQYIFHSFSSSRDVGFKRRT